jgi:protein-S-isoprenylcysteine O-methyltransferase Ste14
VSAIFGWLPIFIFKKWGGVPKGKSYMQTTKVVDRGLYAIVRHPQYVAGMLMSIALPLIAQHWIVAVLGVAAIVMTYRDTFDEEQDCLKKFGDAYTHYMEAVPRVNFLLGIVRLMSRKKARKKY